MMHPACEVKEKVTREKNDGNEALEEGTSPLLDLNSKVIIRRMRKPYHTQRRTGKISSR